MMGSIVVVVVPAAPAWPEISASAAAAAAAACAGPFVDQVRDLNGKGTKHAVTASSGAHVTLPEWYGSTGVGMIVPKTKVSAGRLAAVSMV
jgi:glycerol-3-phosphate dehydrogenase